MRLTSYRTGRMSTWMGGRSRERGGEIINHGWDFIKLRLSCAQRIVYYLLLRGGFAQLRKIHRVRRSSALSLLARVGPRGDLAAYVVAARVCVYLCTRRQSF